MWNSLLDVFRYQGERYDLIQKRHLLEDACARDDPGDVFLYKDLIDRIETSQRLRSAWRYGVPVPDEPKHSNDNDYWDWRFSIGQHVLSIKGQAHLRREIALEKELAEKPWL